MRTWKKPVDGESLKTGLGMEGALCRSKWFGSVNQFVTTLM